MLTRQWLPILNLKLKGLVALCGRTFDFFLLCRPHLASKLVKNAYKTKYQEGFQKTQNCMLISSEKVGQMLLCSPQKSYSDGEMRDHVRQMYHMFVNNIALDGDL
jgi:hypothetical protein